VDHDMGTGAPLLGFSRSSIAQLNRSHPYSSRWATVAFYLEQDTPLLRAQVPEKHIPGGDLLQRLADLDHPKTRRDKTRTR
jgi:hypothetical protein